MNKFNLKTLVLTLSMSAVFAGNVNAASTDVGTLAELPKVASFSQAAGSVSDTIFFDVSSTSTLGAAGIVWTFFGSNISGLTGSVYNLSGDFFGSFSADTTSYYFALPSAGEYKVDLAGTAISPIASYSVALSAVAAPVPEADTYAMMLAGLGLMGFVAARRKSA